MCTSPVSRRILSRTFGTYRWIDTPCGKCSECLKQRQNSWKLRICEESKNWDNVFFFTLTYKPSALPYNVNADTGEMYSTARKKHVQDWLKRLRERISRDYGSRLQMKYFICAEYGPNPNGTKRPHYHGIFLTNATYNDFMPSFKEWSDTYGRIEFKRVTNTKVGDSLESAKSRVANYVSKYCAKGQFESRLDDIKAGRIERAWFISSKNIGYSFITKNKQNYLSFVPSLVDVEGDWQLSDFDILYRNDPNNKIFEEVDKLIDNLKVFNGLDNFGYRMPRYYRERILMAQKTYYDKIPFTNKVKKTKRYVAENFLSVAIAYRLRMRAEARDVEILQTRFKRCPVHSFRSVSNMVLELEMERAASRVSREKIAHSRLGNFYTKNMFSHREFD